MQHKRLNMASWPTEKWRSSPSGVGAAGAAEVEGWGRIRLGHFGHIFNITNCMNSIIATN